MSNSKKTKTVSFRIPEHIIAEIEKDAKSELSSTNTLINKILLHYVIWDKYQQRSQMYPVPKDNLIHVLENFNDSQKSEAIEHVYNAIRDHALLSKKKFDIHSCLEVVQNYCTISNISIQDNIIQSRRVYTINHGLGMNFSRVVEDFVRKIFWDLIKMKIDVKKTKTTVIVTLLSSFD